MNNLKYKDQTIYFKSSKNMEEVDDSSIDVIITSPPYNRKKSYSGDFGGEHNDNMTDEQYFKFLESVWSECYRVAKNNGIFFLNIGDSAIDQGKSEKVVKLAESVGWIRVQDVIWVKSFLGRGHFTPSGGSKRFNNVWEHIYLLVKNKKEYKLDTKAIGIPYADKSNIGRYGDSDLRDPGNVWLIPYQKTTGLSVKKGHEAPFPIGLPYRCIKCVPNCKMVLDPFCGTGSTLAACINLGVKGIGYEKYPRIKTIKQRLKEGLKFEPIAFTLIPHYELAIKLLCDYLNESNYFLSKPDSKKGLIENEILLDVIQNLQIKNSFTKKLRTIINRANKKKDKSSLLNYFDINNK
ncbi:MAG: site-specific DNA-methyltransferase [Promethearchaeota archaeon]|nr:MAG: site-specific DNA-methyltransferase [Candidatus Lokiarchaeota archaeon]